MKKGVFVMLILLGVMVVNVMRIVTIERKSGQKLSSFCIEHSVFRKEVSSTGVA